MRIPDRERQEGERERLRERGKNENHAVLSRFGIILQGDPSGPRELLLPIFDILQHTLNCQSKRSETTSPT